jgi:hypothetical protein
MRCHKQVILALALAASGRALCDEATSGGAGGDAGRWRMRAREHYETLSLTGTGAPATYWGFTNTIDLWYEVPFHYSVGLAGSPLLATLHSGAPPKGFSDTVRLLHLGAELKIFPSAVMPAFFRLGAYQATLMTDGSAGNLTGASGLGGLGYEWNLSGIGLAPELSWRRAVLAKGIAADAFAPCLGVHFYHAL